MIGYANVTRRVVGWVVIAIGFVVFVLGTLGGVAALLSSHRPAGVTTTSLVITMVILLGLGIVVAIFGWIIHGPRTGARASDEPAPTRPDLLP
jgi:hypothetical protein